MLTSLSSDLVSVWRSLPVFAKLAIVHTNRSLRMRTRRLHVQMYRYSLTNHDHAQILQIRDSSCDSDNDNLQHEPHPHRYSSTPALHQTTEEIKTSYCGTTSSFSSSGIYMTNHFRRTTLVFLHRRSSTRRALSSVSSCNFSSSRSNDKCLRQSKTKYFESCCSNSIINRFGSRRYSAQPELSPMALGLCGDGTKFDASVLAEPIREDIRMYTSNLLREGKGMSIINMPIKHRKFISFTFSFIYLSTGTLLSLIYRAS